MLTCPERVPVDKFVEVDLYLPGRRQHRSFL